MRQAEVDQFDVGVRSHFIGQHDVLWLKAHEHGEQLKPTDEPRGRYTSAVTFRSK